MVSITVMISSRCNDPVPDRTKTVSLSDLRVQLKSEIEGILADGTKRAFDVWISEDGDPGPGSSDAWDVCMQQARSCDVLICLYNGHSGWARPGSSVGICEAELQTAVDTAPEKVRLIQLEPSRARKTPPESEWDARFQAYVEKLALYRGGFVAKSADQVRRATLGALRSAIVESTKTGTRAGRMRSAYQGEALDWNRLDFRTRRDRMVAAVTSELLHHPGARQVDAESVVFSVAGVPVLFVCHAIPAAMTLAQARELTGQPFLRDHEYLKSGATAGPVHLIACYGNVTDSQARRQLGFPDATVVSPPFGIWVADPVQKIQMLFLAGCVDSGTARQQAERALEWLARSGEDAQLAARAVSRARIVEAIATELHPQPSAVPRAGAR
jgi:Domain of unknown function (DUF4062)